MLLFLLKCLFSVKKKVEEMLVDHGMNTIKCILAYV